MITSISKEEAIKVMENNLKLLKEYSETDTFLLISYDLENDKNLGKHRLNFINGESLINKSKTFVLNEDSEEDKVSILTIYSAKQKDIYNIIPIGKKHDMILVPQLE